MSPSRIANRRQDDKRNGTAALYAAFNTLTGKVTGKTSGKAFLSFPKRLNRRFSAGKERHIILDNLSAHNIPALREWLEAHPRSLSMSRPPVHRG